MSERKFCQINFWLKLCCAILLFIAAVWLCIYASVYLPQKIGAQASGAGAFVAIFGTGIAIAVAISVTFLISAGSIVLSLSAVIFAVKEYKYSPLNINGENNNKRYLGFRIASDALLALSAVVLLSLAISFGPAALLSLFSSILSIVLIIAAEIMQEINLRRHRNKNKDE